VKWLSHTHVIDGKTLVYPNDKCPICHPELYANQNQKRKLPRVYRKGNTVIVQISKGTMSTTTWWEKGNCFLHTIRKMMRNDKGRVIRSKDGTPMWWEQTMRITIPLAKQYISELSKLINELESATYKNANGEVKTEIPKRG